MACLFTQRIGAWKSAAISKQNIFFSQLSRSYIVLALGLANSAFGKEINNWIPFLLPLQPFDFQPLRVDHFIDGLYIKSFDDNNRSTFLELLHRVCCSTPLSDFQWLYSIFLCKKIWIVWRGYQASKEVLQFQFCQFSIWKLLSGEVGTIYLAILPQERLHTDNWSLKRR